MVLPSPLAESLFAGLFDERTDLCGRGKNHRSSISLHSDADDTRARCLALERSYGQELADELLAHANTAKEKAADLADAWFKAGTSPLAAWTFLAMGEAAEVAVWLAVQTLAAKAEEGAVLRLAAWALPVQRRHLDTALSGVARLAELRDPTGPRWG